MRIFVAGATGAIGSRLVPLLVRAGHTVIGLTHRPDNAKLIASLGARPVVASGLDEAEIRRAVLVARPEVIVHEMTELKNATDLKDFDRSLAASNRLRTQGTDYLMSAGRAAGTRRFIAQSFCGWPFDPSGDPVKDETTELLADPPKEMRRTLNALRYLESVVGASDRFEGIVLRYGALYGPGTGLFEGGFLDQIRQRRLPILGPGDGWWSFLHVDDAAKATAVAVESGGARGIYNIVDDEPAPVREWLPELAFMLGAPPPRHIPLFFARLMAGEHLVHMMAAQRAGLNAKAKAELPWQPSRASWRQGFAEVIEDSLIRQAVA
ncbi:MAG TPA: NAD(P)-dependent oxidoreductase [Candidatus Polarisedimenticolia bacterium]|nr:NAD(P)-dependent oxidoreductase [Candidatus Polarisedimenticolia bacterium]